MACCSFSSQEDRAVVLRCDLSDQSEASDLLRKLFPRKGIRLSDDGHELDKPKQVELVGQQERDDQESTEHSNSSSVADILAKLATGLLILVLLVLLVVQSASGFGQYDSSVNSMPVPLLRVHFAWKEKADQLLEHEVTNLQPLNSPDGPRLTSSDFAVNAADNVEVGDAEVKPTASSFGSSVEAAASSSTMDLSVRVDAGMTAGFTQLRPTGVKVDANKDVTNLGQTEYFTGSTTADVSTSAGVQGGVDSAIAAPRRSGELGVDVSTQLSLADDDWLMRQDLHHYTPRLQRRRIRRKIDSDPDRVPSSPPPPAQVSAGLRQSAQGILLLVLLWMGCWNAQ